MRLRASTEVAAEGQKDEQGNEEHGAGNDAEMGEDLVHKAEGDHLDIVEDLETKKHKFMNEGELKEANEEQDQRSHNHESGLDIENSEMEEDAQREGDSISKNKIEQRKDGEESESESSSSYASSDTSEKPSKAHRQHVSAIQEAQLSPDGTCIFTTDYERKFSAYPIPHDILAAESPLSLTPYAQFTSPDPIWAFASNPHFTLADPSTTHVLVSARDRYINLYNALWDVSNPEGPGTKPINISTKLASYKLVDHLTEAVIAPLSLTYTRDGTHFIAGSKNQISIFDLNNLNGPITKIRTIPSAHSKLKGGGIGYKGHISALSISPAFPTSSGILAAGTWSRFIGLYEAQGSGEQITQFPLPGTVDRQKVWAEQRGGLYGNGVSQLKWSPCGKYLYIAERTSDALFIYDVRNFSMCLGHCIGRNAVTTQKLGFDIWSVGDAAASHEVWAGGIDGSIRVWRDPHLAQGAVKADEVLPVGDVPVSSTLVHPTGSLAIAASGHYEMDGEGNGRKRGGGLRPSFREWGRLDIFGLGGL